MDRVLKTIEAQLAQMTPGARQAAGEALRDLILAGRRFFTKGIKFGMADGLHALGLIMQNAAAGRGLEAVFVQMTDRAPKLGLNHVRQFLSFVPPAGL